MGKKVKVNLDNNNEQNKKEEPEMNENDVNKTADAQPANEGNNLPAAPAKKADNRNLVVRLWKDHGVVGKAADILGGAVITAGIAFGVKLLVGLLFGPEAAESIDPTEIVSTEG